ncbi:MAG: hypothetical protein C5B51_23140 [Terriglobia bacterium]|nr:MAG: hypothetical protein C5B51_23140 [Terriglobia bacterium]
MVAANKNLIHYVIQELFNQKRTELIGAFYSPDCEGYSPDGAFRGHSGFQQFFKNYAAAFPDFRLLVNYVVAEDDRVIVHYTFTGTQTGALAGFPPSGRRVQVPGMMVSRVKDGWITEQQFIWDNLGPRRQNWLAAVSERQIYASVSG